MRGRVRVRESESERGQDIGEGGGGRRRKEGGGRRD